jgi:hypothetical protein
MDARVITINGKRWRLVYESMPGLNGKIDPPSWRRKLLRIHPKVRKDPQLLLETLLHEALHGLCWGFDEDWVDRSACDLARLLWGEGFRLDLEQAVPRRTYKDDK